MTSPQSRRAPSSGSNPLGVIRTFKRLAVLGIGVYLVTLAAVIWQTHEATRAHGNGADLPASQAVGIVLGSGVKGDGILDYAARGRVRLGVRLLAEGKVRSLIVSGGPVRHWQETSAAVMAAYAIALGAPEDRVILEPEARNTFENLAYSAHLAVDGGNNRYVIVTDAFHLPRAKVLGDVLGLDVAGLAAVASPASVRRELGWRPLLREAGAWWVNLWRVSWWYAVGLHPDPIV